MADDDCGVAAHGFAHVVDGEVAVVAKFGEEFKEGAVAFKACAAGAMANGVVPEFVAPACGGCWVVDACAFCDARGAFPGDVSPVVPDEAFEVGDGWWCWGDVEVGEDALGEGGGECHDGVLLVCW